LKFKRTFETPTRRKQGIFVISHARLKARSPVWEIEMLKLPPTDEFCLWRDAPVERCDCPGASRFSIGLLGRDRTSADLAEMGTWLRAIEHASRAPLAATSLGLNVRDRKI
jgi:hypothetical protein